MNIIPDNDPSKTLTAVTKLEVDKSRSALRCLILSIQPAQLYRSHWEAKTSTEMAKRLPDPVPLRAALSAASVADAVVPELVVEEGLSLTLSDLLLAVSFSVEGAAESAIKRFDTTAKLASVCSRASSPLPSAFNDLADLRRAGSTESAVKGAT
jgi:hypothetical protein